MSESQIDLTVNDASDGEIEQAWTDEETQRMEDLYESLIHVPVSDMLNTYQVVAAYLQATCVAAEIAFDEDFYKEMLLKLAAQSQKATEIESVTEEDRTPEIFMMICDHFPTPTPSTTIANKAEWLHCSSIVLREGMEDIVWVDEDCLKNAIMTLKEVKENIVAIEEDLTNEEQRRSEQREAMDAAGHCPEIESVALLDGESPEAFARATEAQQ